jgi:acetamidase/formamidase
VIVPGALFILGDCHEVHRHCQIVGTVVETCSNEQVLHTLEKGRRIGWPRGETSARIYTIGNERPMDQALQHATTEMAVWLMSAYRLSAAGVAHLLGQVVRYEVGNVFNPAYTMICTVEKKWLPKLT